MYSVYTSLNMQICIYIFTTLPRDHEYSFFAHTVNLRHVLSQQFLYLILYLFLFLFNPSTNQPSKKSHIIYNANQKRIKIGTRTKHIHKERKKEISGPQQRRRMRANRVGLSLSFRTHTYTVRSKSSTTQGTSKH